MGARPATSSPQVFFFFAPLFIPFFVMGVPIVDTVFAIVRRARKRSGVAEADKDHLHHRLMRLGHGHRVTVLILWLWTGLLAVFVLVPVYTSKGDALVPLGVGFLALCLLTFLLPGLRRRRGGGDSGELSPTMPVVGSPSGGVVEPADEDDDIFVPGS